MRLLGFNLFKFNRNTTSIKAEFVNNSILTRQYCSIDAKLYPTRYKKIDNGKDKIKSVAEAVALIDKLKSGALPSISNPFTEQKNSSGMPAHPLTSLWFRGHSGSSWALEPGTLRGIEGKFFDEHNGIFHLSSIRPDLRKYNNLFDIVAILQHQGLPTRLLDWSTDVLVPLYFACEKHHDVDGELFVLNPRKLNFYSCGAYWILPSDHPQVLLRTRLAISRDYKDFFKSRDGFFKETIHLAKKYKQEYNEKLPNVQNKGLTDDRFLFGQRLAMPVATHPLYKDPRLIQQQGVFTIHGGKSYLGNTYVKEENKLPRSMEILELQDKVYRLARGEKDIFVISYLIAKENKKDILDQLDRLGVNKGFIYPELEHQATYVKNTWSFPVSNKDDEKKDNQIIKPSLKKEKIDNPVRLLYEYAEKGNVNVESIACIMDQYFGIPDLKDHPMYFQNEYGHTPFYVAASRGHTELVRYFISYFEKNESCFIKSKPLAELIDMPSILGWTPLFSACFYNHEDVVTLLIDKGADIRTTNKKGESLLYHATRNKNENLVKKLVKRNSGITFSPANNGITPLHLACKHGYDAIVKHLIKFKTHHTIDVIENKIFGRTPFQYAALFGRHEIIKHFLENRRKFDLDIDYHTFMHGRSALDLVSSIIDNREETLPKNDYFFSLKKIKDMLKRCGADNLDINSFQIIELNQAINHIQDNNKKEFLKCVSDVIKNNLADLSNDENKDSHNLSIVAYIFALGNKTIIEKLKLWNDKLEDNQKNSDKERIFKENTNGTFKDKKPQLNNAYNALQSLHLISKLKNNDELKKQLEKQQIDIFFKNINDMVINIFKKEDKYGFTIVDYAVRLNDEEIIEMLNKLDDECFIRNTKNSSGSNPLYEACFYGAKKSVEAILNIIKAKYANEPNKKFEVIFRKKMNIGWSPLMVATWGLRKDIIDLILAAFEGHEKNQEEEIKRLKDSYLNLKSGDDKGCSAVSIAIDNFSLLKERESDNASKKLLLDILDIFINRHEAKLADNYNISAYTYTGNNLLHFAASYGVLEVVEAICKKLSSEKCLELINAQNEHGATPLIIAVFYKHKDVYDFMKRIAGINLELTTYDNRKVSDFQQSSGSMVLIACGVASALGLLGLFGKSKKTHEYSIEETEGLRTNPVKVSNSI